MRVFVCSRLSLQRVKALIDRGCFRGAKKTPDTFSISHGPLLGLVLLAATLTILILASGCGDSLKPEETQRAEKTSQVEPSLAKSRLVLSNWEDYLGRDTLRKFEEATGITVELHGYKDDEEVLGALLFGSLDADLIILSESLAEEMVKARLLSPLDINALPNAAHIAPRFLTPSLETGHYYQIPYLMGTTGFLVNTKFVPDHGQSWNVLWDERLKSRLAMLDNPFEVIAAASLMLGFSVNPLPEQIDEIRRALWKQKPLLAGYLDRISLMDKMIAEELWAAQMYSGDGLMAVGQNPDLAYVIPEEGCAAWIDVFVVPLQSKNPEGALAFINFVHTPEIMGEIAGELWTATPNLAARKFVNPEVLNSSIVNPPAEVLGRCEYFGDMGSGESVPLRLKLWAELLAGN